MTSYTDRIRSVLDYCTRSTGARARTNERCYWCRGDTRSLKPENLAIIFCSDACRNAFATMQAACAEEDPP